MDLYRIVSVFLILALGSNSAYAATKLRIATIVPQTSAWGSKIKAASEEIKARTEDRVNLKVYYGGSRGTPDQVLNTIRFGDLEGGDFTPSDFQDKLPDLNVYGLPFVFDSVEEVQYVRQHLDDTLEASFADAGFVTFGFAGDFTVILSNKPIRGLSDLNGQKVWLPPGDAISDRAMKKLNLVPNSKPLADVLIGLKTGLFDVVAMPPGAAIALQLHTAVDYFTDMPVVYAMQFMAITEKAFNKLDSADQAIVREVLTRVYDEIDEQTPKDAVAAKEALIKSGVKLVEPNKGEFAELQRVMAENNRAMARQGMYSLEILDQVQRYIDEYKNQQEENDGSEPASEAGGH